MLRTGQSLYDPANIGVVASHLNASLRAHAMFKRDVDYIVGNDEVVIVDEHTGRTMQGRRWSDGLHQALKPKKAFPFKMKTKPWLLLLSKTSFVSMANWRA